METRTISLKKDGQTYIFRYTPGCEDKLVEQFEYLAEDDRSDLDWVDAAQLSFQLASEVADKCRHLLDSPHLAPPNQPPAESHT